jgi:uncharacterized protein (DUF427 family)
MKAIWNNQVIAEASKDELIYIEGSWYFPGTSINKEYFTPSDHHTTCYWKGEASYYNVTVNGNKNENGAWYYHSPLEGSIPKVKKDFTDYVAFWQGITVTE